MEEVEDCLSCRLISGFGFLGIGAYIIFQGKRAKGLQNLGFALIGLSFGLIGAARLLKIGPFKKEKKLTSPYVFEELQSK